MEPQTQEVQLPERRTLPKISGWLLALLTGAVVFLILGAHYYPHYREQSQSSAAFVAITDKGVNAHFTGASQVILFTHANVTDADLVAFLPAFNDRARSRGFFKITGLRLNGSKVSKEALDKFQRAVPDVKIEP